MPSWPVSPCCLVAKSCSSLCNPMDYSLPGSSVHGVSQTRILEQAAILFSRESSQLRDQIHVSCIGRWILYHRATREAPWPVSPTLSPSVNQYFSVFSLFSPPHKHTHTHTHTHTHDSSQHLTVPPILNLKSRRQLCRKVNTGLLGCLQTGSASPASPN